MRNGGVINKITTHFCQKMGDQRQPSKVDGCTEQPFFGVE
jgi:hypothetical protein